VEREEREGRGEKIGRKRKKKKGKREKL